MSRPSFPGTARRLLPSATAAIMLAACGSQAATIAVGTTGRQNGGFGSAVFRERARVVSARWNASALARKWHSGLVLTDGAALIQTPANAGFSTGRQKVMFFAGRFRLATALPRQSPADVVRWTSGRRLRVPVEEAQTAFRLLATQRSCEPYSCRRLDELTVIGMEPTEVALPTSRGPAEVPAWRYRLAEVPWTFTQVAVEQRAFVAQPGYNVGVGGVPELAEISADGKILTLEVPGGGCTGYPPPRLNSEVYETAGTVVVGAVPAAHQDQPKPGQVCAGVGLMIKVEVRLAHPVGSRVVLDVRSGQPLLDPAQDE